jgi:C-terminal processing protease CtpA/Prc
VRYSATQSFLPDGFNIEGGIPPDIRIDMSEEDRANGVDTILERAIEELAR